MHGLNGVYIFDLFNMDVMVTDPTVCSGLFSSEAAGAQMSGLWFGVNVALESPAAWRLMLLWDSALIDLRALHTKTLLLFFLAN